MGNSYKLQVTSYERSGGVYLRPCPNSVAAEFTSVPFDYKLQYKINLRKFANGVVL